jgi:glycerol-3-phosphate O-acyltransferase
LRPLIRLFNGFFSRLLNIWVKSDVVGIQDASENGLDAEKIIFYALPLRSYAASLVLNQVTKKHALPSALEPVNINGVEFPNRIVFLSKPEGGWFKRRALPYLHKSVPDIVKVSQENPELDIQVVPVNVFWGREPKK